MATLTATHFSGKSNPFEIDNSTYWAKVFSSTTGYAEEISLVIHYRLYLPTVVRSTAS